MFRCPDLPAGVSLTRMLSLFTPHHRAASRAPALFNTQGEGVARSRPARKTTMTSVLFTLGSASAQPRLNTMDGWTLGAAACMLAVAAVPLLLRSRRLQAARGEAVGSEAEAGAPTSDTEATVRRPSSESERAAKQTKKKRAKKASSLPPPEDETAEDETAVAMSLPVLGRGDRVWHKASNELVEVVKVHYEDPPPYYTVRTAAGLERSTIRTRLETAEERAAVAAAAELQAAEARAAAFAAELLAEEATEGQRGKRKPNSGRDKQKKRN